MLGDKGLLHKKQAGAMHVELSSIDSRTPVKLQAAAKKKKFGFSNAPWEKHPHKPKKPKS